MRRRSNGCPLGTAWKREEQFGSIRERLQRFDDQMAPLIDAALSLDAARIRAALPVTSAQMEQGIAALEPADATLLANHQRRCGGLRWPTWSRWPSRCMRCRGFRRCPNQAGRNEPDEDTASPGYWEVLEPYWGTIDIYHDPEKFRAPGRRFPKCRARAIPPISVNRRCAMAACINSLPIPPACWRRKPRRRIGASVWSRWPWCWTGDAFLRLALSAPSSGA